MKHRFVDVIEDNRKFAVEQSAETRSGEFGESLQGSRVKCAADVYMDGSRGGREFGRAGNAVSHVGG